MGLDALGLAVPSDELLDAVVRSVLGDDDAEVLQADAQPVDYESSSPATGGLHRVVGTARSGGQDAVPWSVFVKTLRHVSLSPEIEHMSPEMAQRFAADFPWRWELDQYRREADRMPEGMRMPRIHRVHEADDRHCVLWMEDVRQHTAPWDLARYARAARALGRFAARHAVGRLPSPSPYPIGYALRLYVTTRVQLLGVQPLRNPGPWTEGPLADAVDGALQEDLLRLSDETARWLDRLDELPQTLAHGDASPQNLLVPTEGDDFVVIDWGFGSPCAVGFDLGQLVLGLVQAGEADAAALPEVHAAVLPAYVEGLAEEGLVVPGEVVRFGYVVSMVLRSAFTGLLLERLDEPCTPALREAFRQRALMTRFIVDLGLEELRAEQAVPEIVGGGHGQQR